MKFYFALTIMIAFFLLLFFGIVYTFDKIFQDIARVRVDNVVKI